MAEGTPRRAEPLDAGAAARLEFLRAQECEPPHRGAAVAGRAGAPRAPARGEDGHRPLYEDQGLAFASGVGTALDAQNVVKRHFKPLLRRARLPPIRFRDLRHSCLSVLAQRGEPIRDLQALAGHATAAFTLHRYTPITTLQRGEPQTQ